MSFESPGTDDDRDPRGGPSLGSSVQDISERAIKLVQDEIELAKAELSEKFNKLLKGTVITAVVAVFLFWMISIVLFGFAFLADWGLGWDDGQEFWGFFLVAGVLIALSALGGFVAFKLFKAGSPPIPSKAIEEAQKIKDTFAPAASTSAPPEPARPANAAGSSSSLPYDPPVYKGPGFADDEPTEERDRSKPYEQPKPKPSDDETAY